jgi:hypothetical protein
MVEWSPDERRAPRLEQRAFEPSVRLPSASRHRSVSGHRAAASDETFEVQTRETARFTSYHLRPRATRAFASGLRYEVLR